ncbi:MAG: ABC transporter ATP-binding protein [Sporolactobacillus sp.]
MKNEKKPADEPEYSTFQNVYYYLSNMWHWNKKLLLLCLARVPVLVLLPFIGILMPKLVIDCLTERRSPQYFAVVIALTTLAILICNATNQALDGWIIWNVTSVRMHYIQLIYRKIMTTDYANLEGPEGQQRLERAEQATNANRKGTEAIVEVLILFISNFFGLLLYGEILSVLNVWILVFLLGTALLGFFAFNHAQNYEQGHKPDWTPIEKKLDYLSEKSEDFSTGKDLRLYQMTDWFSDQFQRLISARALWLKRVASRYFMADGISGLFALLRDGLAYAYLLVLVLNGRMTVANFTLYFGMISGFSIWLSGLTEQLTKIRHMCLEIGDVRRYLDLPDPSTHEGGCPLPEEKSWPCSITFDHVTFSYPGSSRKILDDVCVQIKKGEKIALVGLNGAGKTTCMKLLCGFYQPTFGRILIDGKDQEQFDLNDYYKLFTAVFQDIHLIPISIARTIAPNIHQPVDRRRAAHCLHLAGLADKVATLPKGMDSLLVKEVNEGAVQFSGGELQKLLLARALYKKSPILILDEPTAALDPIAENDLYERYGELTSGRTSLFISHRLSSTRFCDRILFLSEGRILEEGTHDQLIKKSGKYAELYKIQSHYYNEEVIPGGEKG